eukprot:m.178680 g.178680  ORF g.178680 m.178680 type:complete len:365 (+) comp53396_c0_seq1:3-1097(+)
MFRAVRACGAHRRLYSGWRIPYTSGPLSREEFEQYFEEGFVLKKDVFRERDLSDTITAIQGLVDDIALRLHRGGRIADLHADAGFYTRLHKIEQQFPNASVLLHKNGVLPPAFQRLWSHPKLLDVARQLIGPDIAGHPVWNLRTKTPRQSQATVPWHQDAAYLDTAAWRVHQLTAWIPLIDATVRTGCMQIVRKGDQTGNVARHVGCTGDTWYIELPEEEIISTLQKDLYNNIVTCEVGFGSVLFLNNLIPHRSLNNTSDMIRWSLDLRWQRPDQPNGVFGLKDSILMASSKDPGMKIQWDEWARKSRHLNAEANSKKTKEELEAEQFSTIITGPWMGLWELVNQNKHTEAYLQNDSKLASSKP